MDLRARFESKVSPEPTTGCHLWTGGMLPNGYGMVWVETQNAQAHRVAWELYRGHIPAGLSIDHLCHQKACVNPAHLRLATTRQNAPNLQGKAQRKFSSIHPGVCWAKKYSRRGGKWRGKWIVQAWLNGRLKRIGISDDESEAGAMYRDAMELVELMQVAGPQHPTEDGPHHGVS